MALKVWNFLLPSGPAAGSHQVRVERLGTPGQIVILDGDVCDTQAVGRHHEVKFQGLGIGNFELRKSGRKWTLYMDGSIIEDYEPHRRINGDESLREVKGKPDGSYLIHTEIDSAVLEPNVVIRFRFVAYGIVHRVDMAHSDCIWQIALDGKVVEREVHTLSDSQGEVPFRVRCERGLPLDAIAQMSLDRGKGSWNYVLRVNGVQVNPHWNKWKGELKPAQEPVRVTESRSEIEARLKKDLALEPSLPERLPQGVSFDASSGRYQANIRMKSGKFMWLGDYATSEEAHKRYLEALPIHSPEKALQSQNLRPQTGSGKPQPGCGMQQYGSTMPQTPALLSARGPPPSTPRKGERDRSTLGLAGRAALGSGLGGLPAGGSPASRASSPPEKSSDPLNRPGNAGITDLASSFGDARSYLQQARPSPRRREMNVTRGFFGGNAGRADS